MRVLGIVLAASLCCGCWVIDELDTSADMIQGPSASQAESEAQSAEAEPGSSGRKGPSLVQRIEKWWAGLTAKRPEPRPDRDPSDVMVRCQVGDSTLFTYRSTCRARKGTEFVLNLDKE